ncbi:MAG: hypothetical protein QOG62_2712 [Thermoleophilaceae bacterium]|jgi:hypothetical protein|nr:hypothetical protein [Thermoleophilaceae bacterium]
MNAFHICGVVLACWAIIVTVLGMTRPDFPKTPGAFRGVVAISITLVALAIGSGIFTAAVEDAEHEEEAAQHAAETQPAAPPAQTP